MRLTVLTAFWQRAHVSRIYWAGMDRLRAAFAREGVTLTVSAVLSPGDDENEALAREREYASLTHAPNRPLAAKLNAASRAAQAHHPDGCVLLDSDDLLSDGMAQGYYGLLLRRVPFSGLADCHVYDLPTGRMGYWPGVADDHPRAHQAACIGRYWSRFVAERLRWQFWEDVPRERGMGWLSSRRVRAHGIPLASERCAAMGGIAVALKSDRNLWPYETIAREPADPGLMAAFPEVAADQVCT